MNNKIYSIAIDGPAGAGKSTIAKLVSKKLNIEYIDTGAMYRALTLKVLRNNLNPLNKNDVIQISKNTEIDFIKNHIYLDGEQVDNEIRDNIINNNVSYIAIIEEIRFNMVKLQQKMAKSKSVVMDGRDITTVVLPNADFKFFITASVEERGRRRYKEIKEKGKTDITLVQIIDEIKKRDDIDSNREISPLKIADDAFVLDTTNMTVDECVNSIISIVKGGI
ncbi:(d)CMP kinase [Paratissierella segnis]|jgi:cytidylate kinase|uniref:Cytidylate kinase n=1 Tax=Paratissierella segnis TaxID=2763679 RepID=A0A926EX94_9FIRM|nr:(d)CMP kinase [Paratissierella segnis]MBC8589232.1 (d)CMP kinase [Paratissierella segnis]